MEKHFKEETLKSVGGAAQEELPLDIPPSVLDLCLASSSRDALFNREGLFN